MTVLLGWKTMVFEATGGPCIQTRDSSLIRSSFHHDATAHNSFPLPQEILDIVLDHVGSVDASNKRDMFSLFACSLSSQALRISARRHLFRTLRIACNSAETLDEQSRRLNDLCHLMTINPHFWSLVRSLHLVLDIGGQMTMPQTQLPIILRMFCAEPRVAEFTGLRSISVGGTSDSIVLLPAFSPEFGHALDCLLHTTRPGVQGLQRVHLVSIGGVPRGIDASLPPSVKELVLEQVIFDSRAVELTLTARPPTISSLVVKGRASRIVPGVTACTLAGLQHLEFSTSLQCDPGLKSLLVHTKANLRSLSIHKIVYRAHPTLQHSTPYNVDIPSFTSLQRLRLAVTLDMGIMGFFSLQQLVARNILTLLSSVSPTSPARIQVIEVEISLTSSRPLGTYDYDCVVPEIFRLDQGWGELDDTIASGGLPELEAVRLAVHLGDQWDFKTMEHRLTREILPLLFFKTRSLVSIRTIETIIRRG